MSQLLRSKLSGYKVPGHRLNLNKNNLTWLLKNIGKENSDKESFKEVCEFLKFLVDNKKFKN